MTDDTEYDVGYKKPPKSSQFPKGESGNPKGRPKGSRNFLSSLDYELQSTIRVTENGKTEVISKTEAIAKTLVNKALQGDLRALIELVKIAQQKELDGGNSLSLPELKASDQQILNDYLKRIGTANENPAQPN